MPIDITDVTRRVQYAGSGTGPYNFSFQILDDGDIAVYQDDTLLVKTTNYTVTINADGTGSITTTASIPGTDNITIIGARPYARLTDFSTGGDFFADSVNDELDGTLILIQQLREESSRALAMSSTGTYSGSLVFPAPGAGEFIRWNLAGTALETIAASPDDNTFTQSGAGAVARSWSAKVGEIISVKDFGAVGDGTTDDSAALSAAIAALPNGGGVIYFPQGNYLINSAVLIDPDTGDDFISNIHFLGSGGHHTNIATRIQLLGGDSSTAGMTLKSCVQMTFEHIDFVGASSKLALVKIQAAGASPYYSSFQIAFRHCRFATTTPVRATVWVNNCSNVTFDNCFFQGAAIAVQIGSSTADAENSGTFGGGTADQIKFHQCFFNGDIVNYRLRGASFDACVFDLNVVAGTRGVRIYAAGDQLVRGLRMENCWAGFGDNTGTFLTMGASGYAITAVGNYIATYAKGIVLDGIGVALIEGNEFALNSSGAMAIQVTTATFYGDNIQNNHYVGMHSSAYRIKDSRSAPGSPVALAPVEVNDNLALDYTITNHGTGFEDVLTESMTITGGWYRIQAMITITTGATASVFRGRVITDAVTPRVGGSIYIPANQTATLMISRDVLLDGGNASTTARLQIYQVTGGTAATVEATDTVHTTMMQITRMGG